MSDNWKKQRRMYSMREEQRGGRGAQREVPRGFKRLERRTRCSECGAEWFPRCPNRACPSRAVGSSRKDHR